MDSEEAIALDRVEGPETRAGDEIFERARMAHEMRRIQARRLKLSNLMPKPMPTTILTVEQRARLIKLMETALKDMKLSLADRIERAHTASGPGGLPLQSKTALSQSGAGPIPEAGCPGW